MSSDFCHFYLIVFLLSNYLQGGPWRFGEETQTQWSGDLIFKILFEARKVAGSATDKQSGTVWDCVVLLKEKEKETKRSLLTVFCFTPKQTEYTNWP